MEPRIATIHQPDFMPWLGFFVKVWRCEVFVVLDHVHNNVKDSSWFRRVRVLSSGKPNWISIPIERPEGGPFQAIKEMKLSDGPACQRMFEKYKRTILQSYGKAPFYEDFASLFLAYFDSDDVFLSRRNMAFVEAVLQILDINVEVVYSSSLNPTAHSNRLLIELLQAVNCDTYLCGDGADGYQDEAMFEAAGIRVVHNRFSPPPYPQVGTKEFVPGLSIMDALFNLGADGTRQLIHEQGKVT